MGVLRARIWDGANREATERATVSSRWNDLELAVLAILTACSDRARDGSVGAVVPLKEAGF